MCECTCPKECDCQAPPTHLSMECPVHNDHPYPAPDCPVHVLDRFGMIVERKERECSLCPVLKIELGVAAEARQRLASERDAALAEVERLKGVLREVEWYWDAEGVACFRCVWCKEEKPKHEEGCRLAAVLASSEPPTPTNQEPQTHSSE